MAISSNREVEFENILRSFVSEGDNQFRALQRRAGAQRARCIAAAQDLTIRQAVNRELDGRWGNTIASDTDLLIVGAGIHGTIAALAAQCIVQVIEKSRMGGGFWTNGPSYYLNSRNRPPREGENIPGGRGALNYIPGGAVQPSDFSGAEYQTNDELASAIRWNLATVYGYVTKEYADSIRYADDGYRVRLLRGSRRYVNAKKVILATGLGRHKFMPKAVESDIFLREMATKNFPLKGLRRVAVIGAGDSGNIVVEALMGQGPSQGMSVAGLDWVEQVDWYGQEALSRSEFESCARSRYAGLARYFPNDDGYYRIQPKPRAIGVIREDDLTYVTYKTVYGDRIGGPYDMVINATGYEQDDSLLDSLGVVEWEEFRIRSDGEAIGLKLRGHEIYKVGPAANLPITETEKFLVPVLGDPRTKNAVAIFRYAPKTAELARRITSKRS